MKQINTVDELLIFFQLKKIKSKAIGFVPTMGSLHVGHESLVKKCKKEKVVEQARDRRYYKKPSDKKREDRKKAERRRIRDELKKQRALEKRMRKNR